MTGSPKLTLASAALSLFVLLIAGCQPPGLPPQTGSSPAEQRSGSVVDSSSEAGGTLTVHFFDVGQGDATLLAGPDFSILVDAGQHDREDVVPLLRAAGIEKLDLLIGTHAHADHIGQFPQVLETFPVSEVWLSGDEATSRTFERTLDAILESDAAFHEPRAGEVVQIGSSQLEVVNPAKLTGDLHEGCVGVRIVFGAIAFMFTGDIEAETELKMIERGHSLQSQILQVGHHGSRTSSSPEFLHAVKPEVAIYSAGEGNSYGHPHAEIVQRLLGLGIRVYGTPEHGTIRVVTNGSTYSVKTGGLPEDATPDGCRPGQVNINTASKEDLLSISHIGDERADELIQLRPFRTLDELAAINGIGAGRLRDIKSQGLACVE